MLKKDLRSDYKKYRKAITDGSLEKGSLAIANASLKLPVWDCEYFHTFLPISRLREVNTSYLISLLKDSSKHVVVPKVANDNELRHYLLTEQTDFDKNDWDIPEPKDGAEIAVRKIDVVFMPLLAFDVRGHRVGYGKGFYDRFLGECREDVVKVGLSLFKAETLIEDVDEHDIPMDYCLTPNKTYFFADS